MATEITKRSVLCRRKGLRTQDLDDALLIEDGNENFYGLELVAKRIWQLLDKPIRFAELCNVLSEEYQIAPRACEADVFEFLKELNLQGLIELPDAGTQGVAVVDE